jgi:broad specificity phosphatase PhoE
LQTLLLARHGFAGSNRDGLASGSVPGEGLTEEGVEQAAGLAATLAGEIVDLGVATEFARTQETLALALGDRDVARLVVPELNEIDFGSFDGGRLADYRAWAAEHPPDLRAPGGGESRADAAARYALGVEKLVDRPERTPLLVGHALSIRYLVDAAAGLVPAPLMAPVEHAGLHRLTADEAAAAASLLREWSRAPRFRDT